MTAVQRDQSAMTLSWATLLRTAWSRTWAELPRVIAAGAIWLASLIPLTVALLSGTPWLIALSTLPVALATTGIARFAARIPRGDRTRVRDVFRVDPILAVVLVVTGTAAAGMIAGGIEILGYVVAAALLVVAPMALAYGAVRERSGLMAIRGGVILAFYRPVVALSLLAVGCLGGFAIAATLGALGLVVPGLLAAFGCAVVAHMLAQIDAEGARA